MDNQKQQQQQQDNIEGQGPWWVWGDGVEALAKDVNYDTMKKIVDDAHAEGLLDVYGDDMDNDIQYEGELS